MYYNNGIHNSREYNNNISMPLMSQGLKHKSRLLRRAEKIKCKKIWNNIFDSIAIDLVQRPLSYFFKPNLMRPFFFPDKKGCP
jgi:hypothetical protein